MEQHTILRVSQRAEQTAVLGPGKRAVIWVYGCCFDCPGCLAQRYRHGTFQRFTPEEIARWYLEIPDVRGLTISGGEPMLQAEALARTIALIRAEKDTDVIVYTGFLYEDLVEKAKQTPDIRAFLNAIDLLIDGPYIREKDDGKPYRGSSNQRLIPLTDRFQADLTGYYAQPTGRQIEIYATPESTVLIGVPDRDQLRIWDKIKAIGET